MEGINRIKAVFVALTKLEALGEELQKLVRHIIYQGMWFSVVIETDYNKYQAHTRYSRINSYQKFRQFPHFHSLINFSSCNYQYYCIKITFTKYRQELLWQVANSHCDPII